QLLEVYLRINYTRDLRLLEPQQLAAFQRFWKMASSHEKSQMGGIPDFHYVRNDLDNPVLLLDLPSSSLMGWHFGDLGRLGFFIAPNDLENEYWDKAWGDVSN
ncbi:MAG: DUF1963 domain-containing protein, partial [Pseudomonadota bacterium]